MIKKLRSLLVKFIIKFGIAKYPKFKKLFEFVNCTLFSTRTSLYPEQFVFAIAYTFMYCKATCLLFVNSKLLI